MPITKESRFRWVRPTATHLNAEVRVWQPMWLREYTGWGDGRPVTEYVNFYNVSLRPQDCELGEWIEHEKPLPATHGSKPTSEYGKNQLIVGQCPHDGNSFCEHCIGDR